VGGVFAGVAFLCGFLALFFGLGHVVALLISGVTGGLVLRE
jgi:hypothetical protein